MKQLLAIILSLFCLSINADEQDSINAQDSLLLGRRMLTASDDGFDESPLMERIFPQSPQSQGLARYGDYPVDLTTGVPNIEIPIYNIQLGDFTLPVSISYHASGIKADEVASTVGLGWTLNAGGMITRQVNGAPDLGCYSTTDYYDFDIVSDVVLNPNCYIANNIIGTNKQQQYDTESDKYTYNFAGHTGIFYYSYKDREYIPANFNRMYIEAFPASYSHSHDSYFHLTDTHGIEYYFCQTELSGIRDDENRVNDISAWYLTDINTKYGDIEIKYDIAPRYCIFYRTEELTVGRTYRYNGFEQYGYEKLADYISCTHPISFETPVVSQIIWNGNVIKFSYSNDRRERFKTRLTKIEVINSIGDTIKSVSFFNDSYWGGRMMLRGIDMSDEGQYSITYNDQDGTLPGYINYEEDGKVLVSDILGGNCNVVDCWGYYNGQVASCLIPKECFRYFKYHYDNLPYYEAQFADRTPSERYTKLGVITSIAYPTGGRTEFSFEGNCRTLEMYGGLRVSKITSRNANNQKITEKSYEYESYGYLSYNPLNTMLYHGVHTTDGYPFPGSVHVFGDIVCKSSPVFPLTPLVSGYYNRITETEMDGTQTIYRYNTDPQASWLDGYVNMGDLPYKKEVLTHDYGTLTPCLLSKEIYDRDSCLLQKELFDYETVSYKEYNAGTRAVSIVKSYSSFGGGPDFTLNGVYGNGNDLRVNPGTIIVDSIMVCSRVCRPTQKRIIDKNGVETIESYTYDAGLYTNLPKTKSHVNSDGKVFMTEYLYPFEFTGEPYDSMIYIRNLYDTPIKKKEFCDGRLLKTNENTYSLRNYYYYLSGRNTTIAGGPAVEKFRVESFGSKGNITRLRTLGHDVDSVLWDQDEVYPVAHVKNGRILNGYSWKPLVGVTGITSENGYTINYGYDSGSRLASISDHNGTMQQFLYNYKNSQSAENTESNYVKTTTYNAADNGHPVEAIQYYDDLGRPTHNCNCGVGTSGGPVYTFAQLDEKGRIRKQTLPLAGTAVCNPENLNVQQLMTGNYADSLAYSTMAYDALDRVTFTSTAGSEWHQANKGKTVEYITNGTDDVKLYSAPLDSESLSKEGFYAPQMLFGEKVIDEDGHISITYTDKIGRKVLERKTSGSHNYDTYYVYNDLGQLRFVLTPDYQLNGKKAISAYEYRYDDRGRLRKKILPQCGEVQYWYDNADRLTFMQDANLRNNNKYRFMLYDNMNRLAIQGLCDACHRNLSGDFSYPEVSLSVPQTGLLGTGYTLNCDGLITNPTIEIANYYDNYDFLSLETGSLSAGFSGLPYTHTSNNALGHITGCIQSASNGQNIYSVLSYDEKGQVIETSIRNLDGKIEHSTTTYTYSGQPETVSTHLMDENSTILSTRQNNSYNEYNNKLVDQETNITSTNGEVQTTVANTYDNLGRLSQMIRPQMVGNVSYTYNLHDWLTNINTSSFKQTLHYTSGEGTPCYNGNISSMLWQNSTYTSGGIIKPRGYIYTYDNLNRLTGAEYGEWSHMQTNVGRYDERILEYTPNGAVKRLQRRGRKQNDVYGKIDNLNIELNGNQILNVTDDAQPLYYEGAMDFVDGANSAVEYKYDGNGNMTCDYNKGIAQIDYDAFNMPRRIQFTNGNVTEYVYTASGQKLRVIHTTAVPGMEVAMETTYDLDDSEVLSKDSIDYMMDGKIILKNGCMDKCLFNGGYCQLSDSLSFHYYNTDHQGNIREVVNENGTLEQVTHYYPFGTPFTDGSALNPGLQPYKYNGKELDLMHGLNTYDYGARQYDPLLIAWHGVDALCEKYYHVSPYVYCMGNPVRFIDTDGRKILLTGDPIFVAEAISLYNDGAQCKAFSYDNETKMVLYTPSEIPNEYEKEIGVLVNQRETIVLRVTYNSEHVLVGDWRKRSIDVADMKNMNKDGMTGAQAILHETVEQNELLPFWPVLNSGISNGETNRIVENAHNVALDAEKRICKIGGICNEIDPIENKLSIKIEGGKTIDFHIENNNIVK